MAGQHHIVKRQLVDLQIDSRLDAEQIRNEVSKILKDKLMPIIGRYLDALSGPDKTDRIDHWEIDLGLIHVDNLQQLLEANLEEQLRFAQPEFSTSALIPAPDQDLPTTQQSDLDLIAYFLQTGAFPWWVKKTEPAVFEKAVKNLLKQDRGVYRKLFDRLANELVLLKRLIYTCSDDLLYLITEKLDPDQKADAKKQQDLYRGLGAGQNERSSRETWWIALFKSALQNTPLYGSFMLPVIKIFFDGFNKSEAILMYQENKNASYTELLFFYNKRTYSLDMVLENFGNAHLHQLKDMLSPLIAHGAANTRGEIVNTETGGDKLHAKIINIQNLLNEIRAFFKLELVKYEILAPTVFNNLTENELRGQHEKLTEAPDLKSDQQIDLLQRPVATDDNKSTKQAGPVQKQAQADNKQLDEPTPLQNTSGAVNKQLDEEATQHNTTAANARQPWKEEKYPTSLADLISSFNDTDKLYIHHAGLILLWPFLSRFFSKIGLITDNVFTDQPAQHKACLLLQYLAMGAEWQPFEPFLPLNKLLCGIDLFEPIDVQIGIMQHEFDEADHLLAAVIGNAPMWKTLSVEGLRQAYLQREGILSARDGNWLLQVKRETYDILVDRLPWVNQIVKLPWMDNLIFVEWQLN